MNMFGGLIGQAQHVAELLKAHHTVFLCGPNRACEHVMDHYVPLTDSDGRVCGETSACSKCGETSFNLSMWNGF